MNRKGHGFAWRAVVAHFAIRPYFYLAVILYVIPSHAACEKIFFCSSHP